MDIRKMVLYVALAIVGMMLWSTWQHDYGPNSKAAQAQANVMASNQTPQTPNIPITDNQAAAVTAKGEGSGDIPSIPVSEKAAQNQTPVSSAIKGQLIQVSTDTLNIAIDTYGGNIVQADLLKYANTLHSAERVSVLNPTVDTLSVAQSGLLGNRGPDTEDTQATYQATQTKYTLAPGQNSLTVNLKTSADGVKITKSFTIQRGQYAVHVAYHIDNQSPTPWQGHLYTQLRQKPLVSDSHFFALHTFTGGSLSTADNTYQKIKYSNMDTHNLNTRSKGGWLAFQQRYFLTSWIPDASTLNQYYSRANQGIYTLGAVGPAISVPAGSTASTSAVLYVGPEMAENLDALAPHLSLTIDYGWLWMISAAIFWVMKKIHHVVGNWGWSIVLVTLLIKLLFYKLSEKSYRSMAKMRKLAPRMQALKERYGDDKQKMSQATMELYKKEKINPISGCLPILIQIPFFIALYWVLIESVELRQAPFLLWIHSLSAQDPYYILPVLMGISMFLQQQMNPAPPDPMQAKMMMFLPVLFTFLFLSFPAGLVLYWLVNNIASGLQQWYITRRVENENNGLKKIR